MAILTPTEVTILSNISASAATIAAGSWIETVQNRIVMLTNNYFTLDLAVEDVMTFNATDRTIIAGANRFTDWNFLAGDDVFIYQSYRNDGYQTLLAVEDKKLTLATGASIVDELSGRSILISIVKWPRDVKEVAAAMVAFDYDVRPRRGDGLRSRSMGPMSESYNVESDELGYPKSITSRLDVHRIARLM